MDKSKNFPHVRLANEHYFRTKNGLHFLYVINLIIYRKFRCVVGEKVVACRANAGNLLYLKTHFRGAEMSYGKIRNLHIHAFVKGTSYEGEK